MSSISVLLITHLFAIPSALLWGQTAAPSTTGTPPLPSASQVARIEESLSPMVTAIHSLEKYHLELETRFDISVQGVTRSFNSVLRNWETKPGKFYLIHQVSSTAGMIVNFAAFSDGGKTHLINVDNHKFSELPQEASQTLHQQIITQANPFVGILINPDIRKQVLSLQTPDQAVVQVSEELLENTPCTKVVLGVAPQETIYYYPIAPPHLPIAVINSSISNSTMKSATRLKWTANSAHPDTIYTPELPANGVRTGNFQELLAESNQAVTLAMQAAFSSGTQTLPTPSSATSR